MASGVTRGTIAPSMVIFRALKSATFGTALGLTLAGCAMSTGSVGPDVAASSPSAVVAGVNRAAAASISTPHAFSSIQPAAGPNTGTRVASLDSMLGNAVPESGHTLTDVGTNPPVVQKGTVLWHRTGDEADLPPTPVVRDELRRLRESLSQVQGQTAQQLTELQGRMDTNQKSIAQVAEDQTRQERDLRAQAADAVGSVAQLATESMRSMERVARNTSDRWFATNQQLAQLEGKLQSAIVDTQTRQAKADERTQAYTDLKVSKAQLETQLASVREARQAAMEAELRAKSFTGQQLASRDQILGGLLSNAETEKQVQAVKLQALKDTTDTKLAAVQAAQGTQFNVLSNQLAGNQQLTAVQLEALKSETATRLASAQAVQGAQLAAVSTQIAANQQLTAMQLAELRKLNDENRALASSETANVAAALRQYSDNQLQQVAASTNSTLASLAEATDQSVADLRTQTNKRLGLMWQAAGQRAEQLAEQKANAVAASLAALQQQTESQKIQPEQIRAIAEQTVADSTPEFRALALRTMQESQDYIRATARAAVQDKDPGMQTALADAARDVITKDDRVVFAIRKAVAEELQGVALDASSTVTGATSIGPDHGRALLGDAEGLDPNRLRIAQLLSPAGGPAPDATKLATLSPASGSAPQAVGGPESWSAPGTSLMRSRNRADWMDIRQYKVVVHEDDQTLEALLSKVLKHAEPFTGPWQVRWKVSAENRDVMTEKFSLDAETSFEEFVSYLAQYVVNDRGVKLSFSLFDNERIIVISD